MIRIERIRLGWHKPKLPGHLTNVTVNIIKIRETEQRVKNWRKKNIKNVVTA